MKCRIALLSLTLLTGAVFAGKPLNSFRNGEIWPDNNGTHINAHGGGFLNHNGRWYWFGEHKIEGGAGNNAHVGVHCYSSDDLYNWKDEGVALKVSDDPASPIVKGCILERPKVIYNPETKKFVMWFHLELKGKSYSAAYSGCAIADQVAGPYRFLHAGRINAGKWPVELKPEERTTEVKGEDDPLATLKRDFPGGQMARDMTLYVDDDGTAYHIFSSEDNKTTHIAELDKTFTRHTGKYTRIFPGRYMEAPAIFKKDGKYYFFASGCTGWAPNAARSAVADSLFGPWKELDNPCRGTSEERGKTFQSQSTFIIPAPGKLGEFIFIADRWRPSNAIDGRYIWLPIQWEDGEPVLYWLGEWQLSVFK